jgi:hypothetical protein
MDTTIDQASLLKRVAYAFVGLLAGDAMLLLYLAQNAFRVRSTLLAVHMGEPAQAIPDALQSFLFFAAFSFVGWLFVGIPTVLLFSGRSIKRLSWPLTLVAGSVLGPLALLVILLLLGHGYIYLSSSFAENATPFAYSILISTVAFAVYAALLRKEFTDAGGRNGFTSPPSLSAPSSKRR